MSRTNYRPTQIYTVPQKSGGLELPLVLGYNSIFPIELFPLPHERKRNKRREREESPVWTNHRIPTTIPTQPEGNPHTTGHNRCTSDATRVKRKSSWWHSNNGHRNPIPFFFSTHKDDHVTSIAAGMSREEGSVTQWLATLLQHWNVVQQWWAGKSRQAKQSPNPSWSLGPYVL